MDFLCQCENHLGKFLCSLFVLLNLIGMTELEIIDVLWGDNHIYFSCDLESNFWKETKKLDS